MKPLLSVADLANQSAVRLLVVSDRADLPDGLVRVPIADWIAHARTTETGLDDTAFWQRELGALGVGPDVPTVVLDDGTMTEAARVWFILQYFGLLAAVLDGGLGALDAMPAVAPRWTGPLVLAPGSGKVGLRSRHDILARLGQIQILDARSAAEFRGDDAKGNPRSGHLPGACHLAHDDLLSGPRLLPVDQIARRLEAAGLDPARPVVTHCNGGGRAALAALAAVVAGAGDVQVYYLSFADWAADGACPLHRTT
jgi:thiosulfate/3-mercaptopyruvate sulfurtransferase